MRLTTAAAEPEYFAVADDAKEMLVVAELIANDQGFHRLT
jgi:hypothetical protein